MKQMPKAAKEYRELVDEAERAIIAHERFPCCARGTFCGFYDGWWTRTKEKEPHLAEHEDVFRSLIEERLRT